MFRDFLGDRNSVVTSQKPLPQHWAIYRIGRSGFGLSGLVNSVATRIGAELTLSDDNAKAYFHLLHTSRQEIESELGEELNWMELPDKKSSRIVLWKTNTDFTDESDWASQHEWLADRLERFHRIFKDRVKALDASDWSGEREMHTEAL